VAGASYAGITTIQNYLAGGPLDAQVRYSALNSNPNDLGLTLVLGLPMAWYLSLAQPRGRLAWAWALYIPLGVTATLLTASRGAVLAGLVALLAIPWTQGHLRLRTKVVLCVLALGTAAFASGFVPESSLQRIASTRSDMESGYFGGRGAIWRAGLEVAREHPFAGVGAGAFSAGVESRLGDRMSAHQTLLSVLVEEGLVGLALFLGMVVAAMTSLPGLTTLQRKFWITLLAALAVGSLSTGWAYRKPLWFVLAVLAAEVGVPRPRKVAQSARAAVPQY
jgi:O-antigen ligase